MGNLKGTKSLSRKEFLRIAGLLGGATAITTLLEACSQVGINPTEESSPENTAEVISATTTEEPTPAVEQKTPEASDTPTASPTVVVASGLSEIAMVKTKDRAMGVHKAIELLGINPAAGKRVFIKPNFNSSNPAPGSTHPDVLRTLALTLQEMGATSITVGDRSGMGDTRNVMEKIGVFQLADELGFDTLVFDELDSDDWVMIQSQSSHWKNGYPFARACLETESLVQTCCLKTHRYGGHFTMSLKNSVGMVAKRKPGDNYNYMNELHKSPYQRTMIAEINAAYTPALVVMDGVEAFISGGPANGELVSPEVVLAGMDRVAIDAVGVALLRYFGCKTDVAKGKIFQQEQIARAVELGLGVDSPEKIAFLTGDAESAAYAEEIKRILL